MKIEGILKLLASDARLVDKWSLADTLDEAAQAIEQLRDRIDDFGGYHDDI